VLRRTVREFVEVVNRTLGDVMKVRYVFPYGAELTVGEADYFLGLGGEERLLSVREQEAIWEYFFEDLDPTLIGLDARID
jgi:hypothetical protein